MSEAEGILDEILGGDEPTLNVKDKRRFNEKGERINDEPEAARKEPVRSPKEIELEARLKEETERRIAAESKLVGVQSKFEEAKASLEKETSEMRARLMKNLEDRAKRSQIDFLATLLPVLDNLGRAVAASETDPSLEHLRDGVIGTARSFEQALMNVGVEPVPSVGSVFDPEVHEAIEVVEADPEMDGRVTAEYSRGYRLGDQLLRPGKVQVGKARAGSAAE